jgi:hypothetical protein
MNGRGYGQHLTGPVGMADRVSGTYSLVHRHLGPDPLIGIVPPHLGLVTKCNVLDIEQDLVLALLVPHLEAGVARVESPWV